MPLLPVALYGLEVPANCGPIPASADFPANFRITMAAIDPSAAPETDGETNGSFKPRATLKIIREPITQGDDDSDDEDDDELRAFLAKNGDLYSDDEEANGGPSDPSKTKKAQELKKLVDALNKDNENSDDDEEMEDAPTSSKVDKKGKAKATGDEDEEDSEDDSDEEDDMEEFVLCTLDPENHYQQALDITVGENEEVYFQVTGTHTIYLTGNYVVPDDNGHNHHHEVYDSDEESEDEDYDLSPDEDELLEGDEDESDELDDLDGPRIKEIDSDEEDVPKLVDTSKKGKNKRAAEEDAGETLDEMMAKSAEEPKLSKKQLKKLKNNEGKAVASKTEEKDTKKDAKSDKKVQFAEKLEQGPTGKDAKPALGSKNVKGVQIDDKKLGSGPVAKKGNRISMRYIGKLTDGKVFDSNKKGKPFTFKLGAGEVIQGWDIGVAGMSVGGERRITVPANLAYGSKALPGIPSNSTLVFDLKLLEIK